VPQRRGLVEVDDDPDDGGADGLLLIRGGKGPPPARLKAELRHQQEHYFGYYENEDRELLIFVHPRYSETGTLYHGGRAWEHFKVVEGVVRQPVLRHVERAWLAACWLSSNQQRERLAHERRRAG
jgi:hypothetical protein